MNRSVAINQLFENMGATRRMMSKAHGQSPVKNMPTRGQLGILMMLGDESVMGIKELAEKFAMSSSAVTQLVDGLVDDGFVTRKEDADDRRKIGLSLTPSGKKKLVESKKEHLASLAKLFAPLTDDELRTFLHISNKVAKHAADASA